MMKKRVSLLFVPATILAWIFGASASTTAASPSEIYLSHVQSGIVALRAWYNTATGLYNSTGWWNSANATTVLVDYALAAHTKTESAIVANTFMAAQKTSPGFINNFYDDEGWWALAWIDAYDLTHNPQYLAMAETIFTDMSGGWDTATCGGGIWWSKDRSYKNAIANELFLSVAAHLANRTRGRQRTQYAEWAGREWKWFTRSGMINPQSLINDGLQFSDPARCTNNGKATWSYNQGVILGALAEYSTVARDPALLQRAGQIANAALIHLVDAGGILHDPCEPDCGADGPQFKGIFARNLMILNRKAPNATYRSFAVKNAESVWKSDRGPDHSFGLIWSGPFDRPDAARQSSALDVLITAALMSHDR
jgi:predicted alpha-1,6-mannanase (GH76 family)